MKKKIPIFRLFFVFFFSFLNHAQVTNKLVEQNVKSVKDHKVRIFPLENIANSLPFSTNKLLASSISPLDQTICSGNTITTINASSPAINNFSSLDCITGGALFFLNVNNNGVYFDVGNTGSVPLRVNGFRIPLISPVTTTVTTGVPFSIYKTTSATTSTGNYTTQANWTKLGDFVASLAAVTGGNGYVVTVELGDNGFSMPVGGSFGIYIVATTPADGFKVGYRSSATSASTIANSNITVTHKVRGSEFFTTDNQLRGFYGDVLYHTNTYGFWSRNNATNVTGTGTAGANFSNATPFPISGTLTNNTVDPQITSYNVTAYDVNGVKDSQTANVTVVTTNPITTVSLNSGVLSADQSGAAYQWFDCNNANTPIPGATNQNYTPTVDGNYGVSITLSPCQSVNSNCTAYLDRNDFTKNELSIYPNPNNGRFFITTLYALDLSIINQLGQVINSLKISSGNDREVIFTKLQNGVYFLKGIADDGRTFTEKIIVRN